MSLLRIKKELKKASTKKKAKASAWFFKTGKGEYGEGDVFIGVTVPEQRKVSLENQDISLRDLQQLVRSPIHEYRLTALFILVSKYKKATLKEKKQIAEFYLKNKKYINNWDLVDSSAPYILGDYLQHRPKRILYTLAKSSSVWDRRIAVLATFWFIKQKQFADSIKLAKILLQDKHDLIQKAVGWMLREVGNKSLETEEAFLMKYAPTMPRTMLRYAIEKFPKEARAYYLLMK